MTEYLLNFIRSRDYMRTPFKYYVLTLISVYLCIGSFGQYVSSSQEILSKERFIADSLTYQLLLSKLKQAEAKISIVLSDMDSKSKKDPFETSIEYSHRIQVLKDRKDSLMSSSVGKIKNQISVLNNNIYRDKPDNQAKLLLDVNKYNADVQVWHAELFKNNKKFSVDLGLKPAEAKILWSAKDQLAIFGLKKLPGGVFNGMEIVYGLPEHRLYIDAYLFDKLKYGKGRLALDDKKPPEVEELEDTKIGTVNQEGAKDEGIVAPPIEAGGVVEAPKEDDYDKVFQKVEIDAEFPGGTAGWTRYITREIERNIDELQDDGRSGTVVVLFIIGEDGFVREARALSYVEAGVPNCLDAKSKLAEIAVAAIKKGPKWKPAVQDGRNVKAYRRMPVSFELAGERGEKKRRRFLFFQ